MTQKKEISGVELARMLRVNHAGEYGAVRIYQGQQAILGNSSVAKTLAHMEEQEQEHKERFEELLVRHRVRPTALSPLWHVMGYAMGAGAALLGKNAAMACTVAVEEVIDEHYQKQLDQLPAEEGAGALSEIRAVIFKCHQEELEHRDTGLEHGAESMPGYRIFSSAVKTASKAAIWLSTRI